ncbi:MAG: phytanoyl-CoA dioxygenase family protein [Proteobacteria bacterium]|nr:phytanoyl-CoA dioxygenase family protein [Pseudomonadota bacterium]MBI3498085.1 phytanoyl-CoA dioxygenase family protein [Pseudomonadota bacterium]
MLTQRDIQKYRRQGYIVVPNVLSAEEVDALRGATDEVIAGAAKVTQHNEVYDLEDGHTPERPRVRRIKTPHQWHPTYTSMVKHPGIVACLVALWGPNVRFDLSKLNMKSPGFGSPVEWHQDWAFYPHTNDDLAAVGIMIDDVGMDNGPMLVIPGSHKGPICDHHVNGHFVGGIDPIRANIDFKKAQPCIGKAGSITIHHVRTVHGSAPNTSTRPRRFLLHQYRSADAWPLIHPPSNFDIYRSLLVAGEETLEPRMERCPIRLPYPPAPNQGSIYENQRELEHRYFTPKDEDRLVPAR